MLMHRPQTPQPGFGSITLLQKFIPHFKILDPRLDLATGRKRQLTTGKRATRLLVLNLRSPIGQASSLICALSSTDVPVLLLDQTRPRSGVPLIVIFVNDPELHQSTKFYLLEIVKVVVLHFSCATAQIWEQLK